MEISDCNGVGVQEKWGWWRNKKDYKVREKEREREGEAKTKERRGGKKKIRTDT